MNKKEHAKIVNFMTPGARVLMLGCGHAYKSYGGNALFL